MVVPCRGCRHEHDGGVDECGIHQDPGYNVTASTSGGWRSCDAPSCLSGECTSPDRACAFTYSYQEGSSLSGGQVRDMVYLSEEEAEDEGLPFTFGCADRMTSLFHSQRVDGIVGLDNNGFGVLTLIDAVSECVRA